jgi:hypothetical protein
MKMRAKLSGAVQLVYDNYNALANGFGPSERVSEAISSVVLHPRRVTLVFPCKAPACRITRSFSRAAEKWRHIFILDVLKS